MNDKRMECVFLWRIENFSYCWHRVGERLVSPEFTANGLEGTVWTLWLYPRGNRHEDEHHMSLFLNRCKVDAGPVDFSVTCELSVLVEQGLPAGRSFEYSFKKGTAYGIGQIVSRKVALLHDKSQYLSQDTLSVRCKMWKGEGNVQELTEINARTRIGIEEISFIHLTENFSKLKTGEKTHHIKYPSKQLHKLNCRLYLTEDSSDEKIVLEITPSAKKQILAKCKIHLLDRSGKNSNCRVADNRLDSTREGIQDLTLFLTRQEILKAESRYLPNDSLSLSCECVFSTGVEYGKIEKITHEKPFAFNKISYEVQCQSIGTATQRLSASPMDDLNVIYKEQFLTDVELKTKTKSFPAHKIWLCARSPVFQTMLTSYMREKNSSVIAIDDLEDDTVQQLLAFLYTDELKELCWESATKLYYAGDKYQIERLKLVCSSFLLDNVSSTSASELLVLADTHTDAYLKDAVEDFILKHDDEVFTCKEWEKLAETNPQLAFQTMLLKYKRKDL